jgi:anti-sigma factor RsiW
MNCSTMIDLLPEYIRRRLSAEESAAVRAHLATCPACAEAYEEELAFEHTIHGVDAPAPPQLLPQIMASVRTQPQHRPSFRVRTLDIVFALAAAFALYGMFIGVNAFRAIFPLIADTLNLGALLSGSTGLILLLTVISGIIGLAISLAVAAIVQSAANRTREPYIS